MAKPRDPSSLPKGWEYGLTGEGMTGPTSPRPSAPRTPQGLLSYIEALGRQANDNLSSAPRHAPILAQASTPSPASTSLDEAHRVENRWPELKVERERRRSIIDNAPGRFRIQLNPEADGGEPWYAEPDLGAKAVRKYDSIIEEEAKRVGIDPNIVRAVMFVEISQGNYLGITPLLEAAGLERSKWPMNVRTSIWSPLVGNADLNDPRVNIRAGATLLRRLMDRTDDYDLAKLGTLYNSLAKDRVTDYGARVQQVYRTRPWESSSDQ